MGKTIQISDKLYDDISSYCKENGLKIGAFCEKMLKQLIMTEKYGDIPYGDIKIAPKIAHKTEEIAPKIEQKVEEMPPNVEEPIVEVIKEEIKEPEIKKETITEVTVPKPRKRRL